MTGGSISTFTWFNNFSPPAPIFSQISWKYLLIVFNINWGLKKHVSSSILYCFFFVGFFFRRRERFQVQQLRWSRSATVLGTGPCSTAWSGRNGSAGESDDNSVRATIRKIKVRMMIEWSIKDTPITACSALGACIYWSKWLARDMLSPLPSRGFAAILLHFNKSVDSRQYRE